MSVRIAGLILLLVSALAAPVATAGASEPASSTLTVPDGTGTQASVAWEGTVQPGANPASECALPTDALSQDSHELTVEVPGDTSGRTWEVGITIAWEPAAASSDLILTVFDEEGQVVANQDGGEPAESVVVQELGPGTFTVVACPFANEVPQPYTATATATTQAVANVRLPAPAPAGGLQFSAAVPADIQRDEGEPIIEIDPNGRVYTCGPTGFSQAEDYWQVSEDGGDQFHLLGEPPRGQQSLGGGGDCALTTSPTENETGFHRVAYNGLSGLLEFATAASDDGGHTIESNAASFVGAGVDRQWIVATSDERVFLNFNRIVPTRQVELCTSTDGGLTYPSCQVVGPSPLFPGPLRSIPAEQNPFGDEPIVYFPWTDGADADHPDMVLLAVSLDDGETWNNCVISTTSGQAGNSFAVADHDGAGEAIYTAFGDKADFNTYLSTVRVDELDRCDGGVEDPAVFKEIELGSERVVVNREGVPTTVFPWVAAGGEPGRVAVAFYGTPTDVAADLVQNPDRIDDDRTWDVYVNQSLNALSAHATFSQVRATTHPNHYDQICLLGLGCTAGGDRSLVDFFAMEYNPVNGELVVVFNRAHKRPGDVAGTVSTPMVVRQVAGPSNGGGTIQPAGRQPLRTSSVDPTGDAIADYSSLFTPPMRNDVPAADLTRVAVLAPIDPVSGDPDPEGGFTVRLHLADLSDAALQQGLLDANAQSLIFMFRFVDGYRYESAQANWDPIRGFTFGYSHYGATPSECGSPSGTEVADDQCLTYFGDTALVGHADQEAGTITMTVPLSLLEALEGLPARPQAHPVEVAAAPGDRIFSAAGFVLSNATSGDDQVQTFLVPLDNAPAMDFLLPGDTVGGAPEAPADPEPAPAPQEEPAPLPATGGGIVVIALLSLAGAVGLTRRR